MASIYTITEIGIFGERKKYMKKITLLNDKTDASIFEIELKYDDTFIIDFGSYDDVKIKIICGDFNTTISLSFYDAHNQIRSVSTIFNPEHEDVLKDIEKIGKYKMSFENSLKPIKKIPFLIN